MNRVSETLVGSIERVTFHHADNGFAVLKTAVIPVHTQHYMMLQRNLFYTGVTRGKSLVVLVGTTKAVAIAVNRADAHRRYSALRWRLAQSTPDFLRLRGEAGDCGFREESEVSLDRSVSLSPRL